MQTYSARLAATRFAPVHEDFVEAAKEFAGRSARDQAVDPRYLPMCPECGARDALLATVRVGAKGNSDVDGVRLTDRGHGVEASERGPFDPEVVQIDCETCGAAVDPVAYLSPVVFVRQRQSAQRVYERLRAEELEAVKPRPVAIQPTPVPACEAPAKPAVERLRRPRGRAEITADEKEQLYDAIDRLEERGWMRTDLARIAGYTNSTSLYNIRENGYGASRDKFDRIIELDSGGTTPEQEGYGDRESRKAEMWRSSLSDQEKEQIWTAIERLRLRGWSWADLSRHAGYASHNAVQAAARRRRGISREAFESLIALDATGDTPSTASEICPAAPLTDDEKQSLYDAVDRLLDRGWTHADLCRHLGYKNRSTISIARRLGNGIGRDRFEVIMALDARGVVPEAASVMKPGDRAKPRSATLGEGDMKHAQTVTIETANTPELLKQTVIGQPGAGVANSGATHPAEVVLELPGITITIRYTAN